MACLTDFLPAHLPGWACLPACAALVKQHQREAEAATLLCELPGNLLCLEGDCGRWGGRVGWGAPPARIAFTCVVLARSQSFPLFVWYCVSRNAGTIGRCLVAPQGSGEGELASKAAAFQLDLKGAVASSYAAWPHALSECDLPSATPAAAACLSFPPPVPMPPCLPHLLLQVICSPRQAFSTTASWH